MSDDPRIGTAPVNQNERRADRAMHAIEAGSDCDFRDGAVGGLESDVRDLLANIRHLCDRWELDYAACDRLGLHDLRGRPRRVTAPGPGGSANARHGSRAGVGCHGR